MNLKTKLNQLKAQAGSRSTSPAPSQQLSRLTIPHRVGNRRLSRKDLETSEITLAEHLQGELIGDGLLEIKKSIPLTIKHGNVDMRELRQHPQLPGDDSDQDRSNVYIDTETTGLSGGSGSLAFLIGFARLKYSAIQLTQFLITRFSSESEMLALFTRAIGNDERLTSYNGKSYDIPLLISRYRIHSLTHHFEQLPHLDLLHPTRRLFRNHWPDCRLATLESRLLGYRRYGDLPGSEAPAAWFSYLQQGRCEKLIKVVNHNRRDIISLVAAHTHLARATEEPDDYAADLYGLARWLAEHDAQRASQILGDRIARLDARSKHLLASLSQRNGDWHRACVLWKELANSGCPQAIERLAKYHEHISKDMKAAQGYCLQLPDSQSRAHRLQRLNRKVGMES
jgi:uncharacterized protein YprB with RNaseH-like and TPR domain